jgi:hypothetical protein
MACSPLLFNDNGKLYARSGDGSTKNPLWARRGYQQTEYVLKPLMLGRGADAPRPPILLGAPGSINQ